MAHRPTLRGRWLRAHHEPLDTSQRERSLAGRASPAVLSRTASCSHCRPRTAAIGLAQPLFLEADLGERLLVTSALTMSEVLEVPLRAANPALAGRYERLITGSRGMRVVDLIRARVKAAASFAPRSAPGRQMRSDSPRRWDRAAGPS